MINGKTYYEILEVDTNATDEQIKKAFRRLSFLYHPDKVPNKEEQFKDVSKAYETLHDKTKRYEYDLHLKINNPKPNSNIQGFMNMSGGGGGGGGLNFNQGDHMDENIGMFFGSLFDNILQSKPKHKQAKASQMLDNFLNIVEDSMLQGNAPHNIPFNMKPHIYAGSFHSDVDLNDLLHGTHKYNKNNNNKSNTQQSATDSEVQSKNNNIVIEDITMKMNVSIENSYHGGIIPLEIKRKIYTGELYQYEKEKIYVTIPQGIDENEIIKMEKMGNHYDNEKKSNLKIIISIQDDIGFKRHFKRDGINMIYTKHITFKESLCGFDFVINHINGKSMKLSSSKGNVILNGDTKVLKGLGFIRNDTKGDLIIVFNVLQPQCKLNDDQLKLIEEIF